MTTELPLAKPSEASVFLSYFAGMDAYIQHTSAQRTSIPFKSIKSVGPSLRELGKLLLNSWSAEYALRITPVVNDEQYLRSSLHWTFPQAYYGAFFSARAFLFAQGVYASREEDVGRKIGRLVMLGYYPGTIDYYGVGYRIDNFQINRLYCSVRNMPLWLFIQETRGDQIKKLYKSLQSNPNKALRDADGLIRHNKINTEQYRYLSKKIGYTTWFNLLSRLRISSTNQDVEKLNLENLDVILFHKHLVSILSHICFVHECYIAKAVGIDAYKSVIRSAPSYLQDSFVKERLFAIEHELSKLVEK